MLLLCVTKSVVLWNPLDKFKNLRQVSFVFWINFCFTNHSAAVVQWFSPDSNTNNNNNIQHMAKQQGSFMRHLHKLKLVQTGFVGFIITA